MSIWSTREVAKLFVDNRGDAGAKGEAVRIAGSRKLGSCCRRARDHGKQSCCVNPTLAAPILLTLRVATRLGEVVVPDAGVDPLLEWSCDDTSPRRGCDWPVGGNCSRLTHDEGHPSGGGRLSAAIERDRMPGKLAP